MSPQPIKATKMRMGIERLRRGGAAGVAGIALAAEADAEATGAAVVAGVAVDPGAGVAAVDDAADAPSGPGIR
jgi:hypothetical protein